MFLRKITEPSENISHTRCINWTFFKIYRTHPVAGDLKHRLTNSYPRGHKQYSWHYTKASWDVKYSQFINAICVDINNTTAIAQLLRDMENIKSINIWFLGQIYYRRLCNIKATLSASTQFSLEHSELEQSPDYCGQLLPLSVIWCPCAEK